MRRYEAQERTELVFEDGEAEKEVEVQVYEDDNWETTLEFKVVLTDPRGCDLGKCLRRSHPARQKRKT